jgi:internalin A
MTEQKIDGILRKAYIEKWRCIAIVVSDIKSIPKDIFGVDNLESLIIPGNGYTTMPGEINHFIGTRDELDKMKIESKTENGLRKIATIEFHYLSEPIRFLSKIEVKKIPSLVFLQITSLSHKLSLEYLPKDVKNSLKLNELVISHTRLKAIPAEIGKLHNLTSLRLSNNQLTILPIELNDLKKIKDLDLRSNQLPLPPEILEKTIQPQIILDYYFSIFKSGEMKAGGIQIGRRLNEIKFIVVGQGSVGKTSLIEKILYDTFDQNQNKTEGISINQWRIENQDKLESKLPPPEAAALG